MRIGEVVAFGGALFILLSGVGVLRFGDVLSRLHALSKAATVGVVLVFTGAALTLPNANDWTSLVLASVLQLATSPIAANLISRSTFLVLTRGPVDADDRSG